MKGKVKWWDDSKGWGFITNERGVDFWVHYTEIKTPGFKTLKPDQKVEFDAYATDRGYEAKEVVKYE